VLEGDRAQTARKLIDRAARRALRAKTADATSPHEPVPVKDPAADAN
jgi:hypothetical protein